MRNILDAIQSGIEECGKTPVLQAATLSDANPNANFVPKEFQPELKVGEPVVAPTFNA